MLVKRQKPCTTSLVPQFLSKTEEGKENDFSTNHDFIGELGLFEEDQERTVFSFRQSPL